jgi:hypothetical protein
MAAPKRGDVEAGTLHRVAPDGALPELPSALWRECHLPKAVPGEREFL